MAQSASVKGADTVVKNIVLFTRRFIDEVNKDMEQVLFLLEQKVTKNMTLTDHTLQSLREMGHPYSVRHPQQIHTPEYAVHKQSGQLLSGKYSGMKRASVSGGDLSAKVYVGISENIDHALHVIYGTSKMIPRDFLTGSLEEIKEQAINILRRSLNGAVINFQGEKVKL